MANDKKFTLIGAVLGLALTPALISDPLAALIGLSVGVAGFAIVEAVGRRAKAEALAKQKAALAAKKKAQAKVAAPTPEEARRALVQSLFTMAPVGEAPNVHATGVGLKNED